MGNRITLLSVFVALFGLACSEGAQPEETNAAHSAGAEVPPRDAPAAGAVATSTDRRRGAVSDAELGAFADVVIQLTLLEEQGAARAHAGEALADVRADMQAEAESVFQDAGLTRERFVEIA